MRHINLTINNLFCKNIFTKSKDSKDVFNKTNKIIIFIDKIYDELVENSTPKPPELPDGWDGNKIEPVESEDNVTIPVPIGYTASKATGENSVSGGFVIYGA